MSIFPLNVDVPILHMYLAIEILRIVINSLAEWMVGYTLLELATIIIVKKI